MTHLTKYSFGATSAIVTSLAFIVSLSGNVEPRMPIIGSLLVFAVADNISDSLGIHIFQESDLKKPSIVNTSTLSNFATRFFVILSFIAIVYLAPTQAAVIISAIWGISILMTLSYLIAVEQAHNPITGMLLHLAIAVLVIISSLLIRSWITAFFGSL